MLNMKIAKKKDIEDIEKLYGQCIDYLDSQGIFQWDYKYPNNETFRNSIQNHSQYLFIYNTELIGSVILNEIQAEEWQVLPWQHTNGKSLIIHALAIHVACHGLGFGQKVLELCEDFGRAHGYRSIRLDVFSENPAALSLYEKNQYSKVGKVSFSYKPIGHQVYYCYEKKLE